MEQTPNGHVMTLADLEAGREGMVVSLQGGPGFIGRIVSLGFTPGATVRMVRNPGRGPVIVSILNTQLALGRGQAKHILIKPAPHTLSKG